MTPEELQKAQAIAQKGITLSETGRHDLAARLFEQASSLAPEDPDILFLLGSSFLTFRDLNKAGEIYLKVKALCLDDPRRLLSLMRPLNAAGLPLEALEAIRRAEAIIDKVEFEKLLKAKTGDVIVIAESLTRHGRNDLAREAYLLAQRVFPDAFPALHMLWLHQLRMGELEGALNTINAVPQYPGEAEEATRARYRALCEWAISAFADMPSFANDASKHSNGKPVLIYAMASWGEDYISLAEGSLRSLAAPGNIPALAEKYDVRLLLITPQGSYDQLASSGVFELFDGCFPVEHLVMPDEVVLSQEHLKPTPLMYYTYSIAMHLGVALAKEMNGAIAPLFTDAIFADGSWRHIANLIDQGYEAINGTCPACNREAMTEAVEGLRTDAGTLELSPDELMSLAGKNLHIIVTSALVSPQNHDFSCPPGILYWRNGTTLAAHGFHIHPLYISAKALATYDHYKFTSMDGHLCLNVFPDESDWGKTRIVENTENYGLVSLTSAHQESVTTKRPFSIAVGRQYLEDKSMIAPFNQWMFRQKIEFQNVFPEGSQDEYDPTIVEAILAPHSSDEGGA